MEQGSDNVKTALEAVNLNTSAFESEDVQLDRMVARSQSAVGRMQAIQAGNEIVSQNVQQLRDLMATQINMQCNYITQQGDRKAVSPPDDSESSIADRYAFYHAHSLGLTAADEVELRGQARLTTDARLTDTKKQMLMLRASGLNRSEIARTIGISRQAVSKSLASTPSSFQLGGAPEHPVR